MKYDADWEKINEGLKEIFSQRFGITEEKFLAMNRDIHLMGAEYNFDHQHMLYLFFDIEKWFNIRMPDEAIISGRFASINNIAEIIYEQLLGKNMQQVG